MPARRPVRLSRLGNLESRMRFRFPAATAAAIVALGCRTAPEGAVAFEHVNVRDELKPHMP